MNDLILENLYEFWKTIVSISGTLVKNEFYSAVFVENAEWPCRIFDIKNRRGLVEVILKQREREFLPETLLIKVPNDLSSEAGCEFLFSQTNMALNLKNYKIMPVENQHIFEVRTQSDAVLFAETASCAFKYRVDPVVIFKTIMATDQILFFNYIEKNRGLGCGCIFFDSNGNAGFHLIGTREEGRGKGIGIAITENLIRIAMIRDRRFAVLNASEMGKSLYSKLGFEKYGEVEIYKISERGVSSQNLYL